ncbi:MMPL family transporter [Actinomadura rudentiformis]|uniref:MMPL family transporter n=1 Tax=Actinomadura rudentiformis TaxID=359158 RepID=A0A6H9YIZ7_9ACTN|nr:MMPL family transporter [Actinomadura rudentiformis]KAB2342653.1 MMPL family transporter [Actinomadura rudentiformis]
MVRTVTGFSVRRPYIVIVIWIAVLAGGFGIGTGVFERLTPEVGKVSGSESARAEKRLDQAAPRPERLTAVITGKPAGDPALRSALAAVRAVPGIAGVTDPVPSAVPATTGGDAVLLEVMVAPGDTEEDAAEAAAAKLRGVVGAEVTIAGGPLSEAEFDEQAQEDVARAEMLSMPVVLILLLVIFGGLLAAGLPLLIAVVGIGSTFGILYVFSTVTEVSVYSSQITTMLAVGLGVDYALLMVSRFREERRTGPGEAGPDVAAAVARTTATAGRTIVFSGLTVMVAFAGLMVFPDPFLRSMGMAGGAVVLADMLAALTLLPALLSRFGHRISPAREGGGRGVFARVARGVQRRPVLTLVATLGVMATLAGPVLGMHISQGDPRMLPESTSTRQLWDKLAVHYPERAQWAGRIQVLADAPAGNPDLARMRQAIEAMPGAAEVEEVKLGPTQTVLLATPQGPGEKPAEDAVKAIRDLPVPFKVEVTGDSARMVDYRAMLTERIPWAAALMALGTLVLLFAFTGSIVLPIKAVLTNVLSIGAALGIVVWVFQDGHFAELLGTQGLGYLNLTVPVLVGAIAFGLSVDYEVFLLSRIRERWLAGDGPQGAVAEGLQRTGGIVTAAALLIAVVFTGFVFGGFAPIKAIGLGLVLAIALDATIVRMLLVPATMTLLGARNWWLPRPLRRVHDRVALAEPAATAAPAAPEPETVH